MFIVFIDPYVHEDRILDLLRRPIHKSDISFYLGRLIMRTGVGFSGCHKT